MKTIAIILTAVALAAPVCAHAGVKAEKKGLAQKSVVAAQATGCQPDEQDPEPYIVHG